MPSPNLPRFFALFGLVLVAMGGVVWSVRSLTPALTVVPRESRSPAAAAGGVFGVTSATGERSATGVDSATGVTSATGVDSATGVTSAIAVDSATGVTSATGVDSATGERAIGEPIRWWAADPVAYGVGGSYLVDQRILSVSGGTLCTPVADALGRSVRRSEEEFAHTPGTARFDLTSRPGVRGVLQPGGAFQTMTLFGEHEGVRYSFVMRGTFTPQGFVARTVTATDAVIRYRQRQQCVIAADLVGTRVPPRDSARAPGADAAPPAPSSRDRSSRSVRWP